jgi:pimeloyl-ACP methyl ester carboxylesterase
MVKYLKQSQLKPPYVLVAHSYGGTFARCFLQNHSTDVAGMVLVETGQETALPPDVENDQYRRQILGDRPLSVIRGNSLLAGYAKVRAQLDAVHTEEERQQIREGSYFQLLQNMNKEDEELKRRQLLLSRITIYIHLPDCGHHVIRDRPDVVAEQVDWVMARLVVDDVNVTGGWLHRLKKMIRRTQIPNVQK